MCAKSELPLLVLSVWQSVPGLVDPVVLVVLVSVVRPAWSQDDVGLLIDVVVVRVEVLVVVVVKDTWLPVVLSQDVDQGLDMSRVSDIVSIVLWLSAVKSWGVRDTFHISLGLVLSGLDRKVVNWLISWFVTPVGP